MDHFSSYLPLIYIITLPGVCCQNCFMGSTHTHWSLVNRVSVGHQVSSCPLSISVYIVHNSLWVLIAIALIADWPERINTQTPWISSSFVGILKQEILLAVFTYFEAELLLLVKGSVDWYFKGVVIVFDIPLYYLFCFFTMNRPSIEEWCKKIRSPTAL